MSRRALYMTHADRANRRDTIKARLLNGDKPAEIAKDYGLSLVWVRQIAKAAGLARSRGRPIGSRWWADCPQHLADEYDFLCRTKKIPVAEIKAMLEQAA